MRKVLRIPIYDIEVTLVVEQDFEAAAEEAGYHYDVGDANGLCLHYPDAPSQFCLIFREGCTSPGGIAHEAYHLTTKIMKHAGVHYSDENQEPHAYLIGFIVDLIHQCLFPQEKV